MITKTTLKPGVNRTKGLTEKYGGRLVCVRYKYDETTRKRYTTVELIEEEAKWIVEPTPSTPERTEPSSKQLAIRVEYWETELRERVKAAGGIRRPRLKLWELRYEDVVALNLESRVVTDALDP